MTGCFDAIELCLQVPLFGSTIKIYLILNLNLQLFSFGDARATSRKEQCWQLITQPDHGRFELI